MGELLLNDGKYNGEVIIEKDFVDFIRESHTHSGGHYGGHFWLNPGGITEEEDALLHDKHPVREKNGWLKATLPHDAYYMSGHDGQSVFILPSERLVITRLGFTKNQEYTESLFASLMTCISPARKA